MSTARKMGRPKIKPEDRRDIKLEIRVSRRELDALTAAAPANLSTWARDVLLRAAKRAR